MKKIIFVILLLLLTSSVFGARYWNPWARNWYFTIEGEEYHFVFNHQQECFDVETGKKYWYDWGYDDVLTIFDFNGQDYNFKVDFGNNEYTVEGYDEELGIEMEGFAAID